MLSRFAHAALGATALLAAGSLATAQGQTNPTADQLIQSLRPTAKSLNAPTRGIRPLAPAEPEAVAPSRASPVAIAAPAHPQRAASAPAAAAQPAAPSATLHVEFATGSAELTPEAMATLDELGKALSSDQLSAYRFRIEGYTDTVGSKGLNQSLSERRAAAVAAYVEQKFGIQQARLVTIGLGETHLLVPTPPQTPEPRNRRVQVINLGA